MPASRSRHYGRASLTDHDRDRAVEYDTLTCKHCQQVIFVKPGSAQTVYLVLNRTTQQWEEQMGAFCRVCMSPVCLACEALGRCRPWERRLEAAERRADLRRMVARA
jgi:hypothetical protein